MSYTVYAILENDKPVYVGMTNNFNRRKSEQKYTRNLDERHAFKTLHYGINKEEARLSEEKFIKKYNTINDGWNIANGFGGKGLPTVENGGQFSKGNKKWKRRELKRVLCVDTGETFDSVRDCAKAMNLKEGGIYKACNGFRKTYKKLRFEYTK